MSLKLRERFDNEELRENLKRAGLRGQANIVYFHVFPRRGARRHFLFALFYVFVLYDTGYPPLINFFIALGAGFLGFYVPNMFISNRVQKRQLSIKQAFPDALDMLLICVQSGMSVEAAFAKVGKEIASQSIELAEEMTLTTAELSYLQDRRQAYENLAKRTRPAGRQSGDDGARAGRALRHAGRPGASDDGQGEPRDPAIGSRAQGRRLAAEADRTDDRVLPAGALHRHSRSGGHQLHAIWRNSAGSVAPFLFKNVLRWPWSVYGSGPHLF